MLGLGLGLGVANPNPNNPYLVAGVHEHADARRELRGQQLLVALHPVAVELEAEGDAAVAVRPLVSRDAERRLHLWPRKVGRHIAKVIAQRRLGAPDEGQGPCAMSG